MRGYSSAGERMTEAHGVRGSTPRIPTFKMSFSFEFRTVETRKDLARLLTFVRKQDLHYPEYQDWVDRTETEVEMGWKTGVIALSNGHVVGDIIWQPHKEIIFVREIKNLRIHPSVRERYFAKFLIKQAETESRDYHALMLDLREDHPEKRPLMNMLVSMGYEKLYSVNLYDPNIRDIVMVKKAA